MKQLHIITLICLILISCNSKKKKDLIKKHYPNEQITQKLTNKKAKKLFENVSYYYDQGDLSSAEFYCKEILKIERSPIIFNELGVIELNRKNVDLALDYFDEAIEADMTFWPSYIAKSRTLLIHSKYKKAENTLIKMLQICKSDYWKSYANFYLGAIAINTKKSCLEISNYLNKAKSMKSDSYLKEFYLKVFEKYKKNCS